MTFLLKQLKAVFAFTAIASIAQTSAALAEETKKSKGIEIDPVVVTATRTKNPLNTLPYSVESVDKSVFDDQQAKTVGDVLKRLPGVDFGGGPRLDAQMPTVRGYYGRDIALTIDGARVNQEAGAGAIYSPLRIDPSFLANAEVFKGSTSLYGSGGVGGLFAFRTITALDLLRDGRSLGASVKGSLNSADSAWHETAKVYGMADGFDVLVAYGTDQWGRMRQGGGSFLTPNNGRYHSGLLSAGYQATDNLRFEFSDMSFDETIVRPNNPATDLSLGTPGTVPSQPNSTHHSNTVFKTLIGDEDDMALNMTAYRNVLNFRTEKSRDPNFAALGTSTNNAQTIGGGLQGFLVHGAPESIGQRLTARIDISREKDNSASNNSPNPVNPNGTQTITGFYVQDEITLNSIWKLIPSVRYDNYQSKGIVGTGTATMTSKDSHFSPKIAGSVQPYSWLNIFANYGQGFRAPALQELYQSTTFATTNFFNFSANPGLKAQIDTTAEIGTAMNFNGLVTEDDQANLRVVGYDSRVNNLIQSIATSTYRRTGFFAGTGSVLQYVNLANAKRRGFEANAKYKSGPVELGLGYSRIRITVPLQTAGPTNTIVGPNVFSPPDKTTASIGYEYAPLNINFLWNGSFVAAQNYDSVVLRQRAGYTVHDLFLTWAPDDLLHGVTDKIHGVKLHLGVTNVADSRYSSYQSSLATALTLNEGRSIKTALEITF